MNTQHVNHLTGIILSLLGYFSLALMSSAVKGLANIPTPTIVFFQFAICLLLSLPGILRHGAVHFKTTRPLLLALRCLTGMLSMLAMFFAIKVMPLANAVLLQNTVPLFVPLILWLVFKRNMSPLLWCNVAVGFLGVLLILKPNTGIINVSALIGLSAGVLSAISVVSLSLLKTTESTERMLFYFFLSGAIVTAPFMLLHWVPLHMKEILLLLGVGVCMYLGQWFTTHAFSHAKANIIATLSYSMVVFSVLLAGLFWHTVPDGVAFIGMILVTLGGVLTIIFNSTRATTVAPPPDHADKKNGSLLSRKCFAQ